MKFLNHIFIVLAALLLGSYSSYAMDDPNQTDEDIIVESVEFDDAFKATGLYDISQAQKDTLKTWILSQQRLYGDKKESEKFINPPQLVLEEIIEQMGNKLAPLTPEMIDWLQVWDPAWERFKLSLDGKYIFVKYKNGGYKLLSAETFSPISTWEKSLYSVKLDKITFSPDGKYILIIYYSDNRIELRKIEDNSVIASKILEYHPNTVQLSKFPLDDLHGLPDIFRSSAFSLDSKYMLVQYNDGLVKLLNIEDPSHITDKQLQGVKSIEFSPDSKYILVQYNNNSAELLNIADLSPVNDKQLQGVKSIKFSPNGKYIFAYYDDNDYLRGKVKLLNTKDLSLVIDEQLQNIWYIKFSPDSKYILVRYNNDPNNIKLLYTENFSPITDKQLQGVKSIEFSPDSKYMLIRYKNDPNNIKLLNIEDPSPITDKQLQGVEFIKFSPDSKYILVQYNNNSVELLNTKDLSSVTDRILMPMSNNRFSPNGKWLVIKERNQNILKLLILNINEILNRVSMNELRLIAKVYNDHNNLNKLKLDLEETITYNKLPTLLQARLREFVILSPKE